ncbi:MAG: 50S ribosomal protein L30e [Candidatus Aenigmatarchaeota archaeon]
MDLIKEIQMALKENRVIIGYRESIDFIKSNKPKLVVMAKNVPENMRKEIEHNAKIFDLEVIVFEGSSKELGVICGKPFPISTLVIKG